MVASAIVLTAASTAATIRSAYGTARASDDGSSSRLRKACTPAAIASTTAIATSQPIMPSPSVTSCSNERAIGSNVTTREATTDQRPKICSIR
jgi:hypothetical protein